MSYSIEEVLIWILYDEYFRSSAREIRLSELKMNQDQRFIVCQNYKEGVVVKPCKREDLLKLKHCNRIQDKPE